MSKIIINSDILKWNVFNRRDVFEVWACSVQSVITLFSPKAPVLSLWYLTFLWWWIEIYGFVGCDALQSGLYVDTNFSCSPVASILSVQESFVIMH